MTLQLNPADQRILEIAKDLCQKLNISSIRPEWVSWSGYAPGGSLLTGRLMTVPFDGCVFDENTIVLAEGFRDQLQPEDWGPLIASELIYMDRFQERLWRGLLPRVTIPTILSFLAGVLIWLFGIVNPSETIASKGGPVPLLEVFFALLIPASILLSLPAYLFLGLPFSKNLRLMADREAVQVTGKDRFLSVLEKVGKLIPKLMVGKRPDSHYPFDRPSIKRRIEAIQSVSSQSNLKNRVGAQME